MPASRRRRSPRPQIASFRSSTPMTTRAIRRSMILFGARDLGIASPRCAWFQRCEEGSSRQRLVAELAFKKRELGVVSGCEFAPKGLAEHRTSPRNDGSDLGRNFPFFAHALPRKRDGTLHERTFPLWRGILGGHGPMVLAIRGQGCYRSSRCFSMHAEPVGGVIRVSPQVRRSARIPNVRYSCSARPRDYRPHQLGHLGYSAHVS